MIKTKVISANALKITAPKKLEARDFSEIAPEIDSLISQHGQIRLLVDVSGFKGWESFAALKSHAGFVKAHQKKVERIAVIGAHAWQHWLIAAVRIIFLHPEIRTFDKTHEGEALQWIVSQSGLPKARGPVS